MMKKHFNTIKEEKDLNNTEVITESTDSSYEVVSISVVDMMKVAINNWWVIALAGIICAIAFFAYSKATSVPVYVSEGNLYVDTKRDHINDNVDATAILDAQNLIPTYIEILESRTFNKLLSDEMDEKYTFEEIADMVRFTQISDTNILTIRVTCLDKDDAYRLCKAVLDNASDSILRIFEGGLVRVIDYPENEPATVLVSLAKRSVIGFVLGAVIAFAVLVILNMFDTRITSSKELSGRYGCPVLGEIPSIKRAYSYSRKYSYSKGGYR